MQIWLFYLLYYRININFHFIIFEIPKDFLKIFSLIIYKYKFYSQKLIIKILKIEKKNNTI